jgi:hypothetical protein
MRSPVSLFAAIPLELFPTRPPRRGRHAEDSQGDGLSETAFIIDKRGKGVGGQPCIFKNSVQGPDVLKAADFEVRFFTRGTRWISAVTPL